MAVANNGFANSVSAHNWHLFPLASTYQKPSLVIGKQASPSLSASLQLCWHCMEHAYTYWISMA